MARTTPGALGAEGHPPRRRHRAHGVDHRVPGRRRSDLGRHRLGRRPGRLGRLARPDQAGDLRELGARKDGQHHQADPAGDQEALPSRQAPAFRVGGHRHGMKLIAGLSVHCSHGGGLSCNFRGSKDENMRSPVAFVFRAHRCRRSGRSAGSADKMSTNVPGDSAAQAKRVATRIEGLLMGGSGDDHRPPRRSSGERCLCGRALNAGHTLHLGSEPFAHRAEDQLFDLDLTAQFEGPAGQELRFGQDRRRESRT